MITSTDILFTKSRLVDIISYLEESDVKSLIGLADDKANSLIHHWAYRNRLDIIQALLKYQKDYRELETPEDGQTNEKLIQDWINSKNSEGFTAAHYASNVGNIEMLQYLKKQGANLRACSNNDLNLLHLAAQGDKLNSMIQLSDLIELDSKDDQGWTSLHWAAQMGSDSIVQFLLANGAQMNERNKDGETALYVACKQGQTKIVRKLLIKGADRQIQNNQGQRPIQIATQYQFNVIKRMLDNSYNIFDYLKFYLNTQIKYQPQQRSICMPLVFILTSLFVILSSHLLVKAPLDIYIVVAVPSAFYSVMFLIYVTLLSPPEIIGQPSDYKFLVDKLPICAECRIPRIQRSFHCPICKVCIAQYDHHCPWINGCVGKRNVVRFILFLILLIFGLMECCGLSFLGILKQEHWNSPFPVFRQNQVWKIIRKSVLYLDISITLLFLFPLLYLIYIQVSNVFLNKTTFERFTKTGKQPIKMSTLGSSQHSLLSTFQEPDHCSFANCLKMCGDSQIQYQYKKKKQNDYNIDE